MADNRQPARANRTALVRGALAASLLASSLLIAHRSFAADQATFATPDAAVAALVTAIQSGPPSAVETILGPGSAALVQSGDPTKDAEERQKFLTAEATKHSLVANGPDSMTLQVGANDWPLPIPVIRTGGRWHFDSKEGAEEIVDRRIGRNEIAAIRVCLAYDDAQKDYFDLFKQAHGTGVYAQLLVSTAGNYDGLYWPSETGVPESPLTPLVEQAVAEGYPGQLVSGKRAPYQGYYYRIITQQGPDAPEGAKHYIQDGKMTGGFALVAWPTIYGASGVMTFITSQDGDVFQKDLGPGTAKDVATITAFNPDLSWTRVNVTNTP